MLSSQNSLSLLALHQFRVLAVRSVSTASPFISQLSCSFTHKTNPSQSQIRRSTKRPAWERIHRLKFSNTAHDKADFHSPNQLQTSTLGISPYLHPNPPIPYYLENYYWWAYVSPSMIRALDRKFLVDIVLWGNFSRLRDAALTELCKFSSSNMIEGKTLQVSCVYANLTEHLVDRLGPNATLDVVDVVPAQLENLERKLHQSNSIKNNQVTLSCYDAIDLDGFDDETFDQVLLFFLLHETPDDVRRKALTEACRVLRPNGGKLTIIDYHRPKSKLWQFIMSTMYRIYEPFAYDLWEHDLQQWFPESMREIETKKATFFGGLYQKVVVLK